MFAETVRVAGGEFAFSADEGQRNLDAGYHQSRGLQQVLGIGRAND